ncbi:MAG: PD-(D/E)XK nuclease family protein [Candidatus Nanopelagicales bacterium]
MSISPPATRDPGIRVREVSENRGHPVLGALSPSRAGDFLQCPLLYRFRTIDRLPERPGLAAFRGTLVHEVLDRLFDLEPQARDLAAATALTEPALADLLAAEPEAAFALEEDAAWPGPVPEVSEDSRTAVLAQARALLEAYFVMEDPTQVVPEQREQLVEVVLEDEFVLRGYVDRLDSTAAGLRVVDYKTGRSPGPMWEQSAMFQLRFYALIVHRATGRLPHRLQLLYLGNGEVLTYHPDAEDLDRFERKLRALWTAITRAADRSDWRPNQSKKCQWCSHQALCPAFGGTPPPLPGQPDSGSSLTVVQ